MKRGPTHFFKREHKQQFFLELLREHKAAKEDTLSPVAIVVFP
jgi:hypothetical protein